MVAHVHASNLSMPARSAARERRVRRSGAGADADLPVVALDPRATTPPPYPNTSRARVAVSPPAMAPLSPVMKAPR